MTNLERGILKRESHPADESVSTPKHLAKVQSNNDPCCHPEVICPDPLSFLYLFSFPPYLPTLPIPRPTARGEHRRFPIQATGVDPAGTFGLLLGEAFLLPLEQLVSDDDDPGALVVAEQLEDLELFVDVLLGHGGQTGDLGDAGGELRRWAVSRRREPQRRVRVQVFRRRCVCRGSRRWEPRWIRQQLDQYLLPELSVAEQAQI